jgi:DNA processing protein
MEIKRADPSAPSPPRFRRHILPPPRRTAPYDVEPGYFEPGGLWLYGNSRLLDANLATVIKACGKPLHCPADLDLIELEAEELVLDSRVLVCGVHNPAHQRAAIVPLRWGAPRVLVVSGGFYHHLGKELQDEPFRAARLWRYQFDPRTDLVVSRRSPEKLPTFAWHNPTVDRLIKLLVRREWPGLRAPEELLFTVHELVKPA